MSRYVLLSEAVPLVAAGLYEGGADAARKCEHARRLLGFSDGDVFYPSMSGLNAVELGALRKSIDKIYEWLCTGKLDAIGARGGCSALNYVAASEWGYRGISDVRWHLSAIRKWTNLAEIEDIKIDLGEIECLIVAHNKIDRINAMTIEGQKEQDRSLQKFKGGRPQAQGLNVYLDKMHKGLLDGTFRSRRHAALEIRIEMINDDTISKNNIPCQKTFERHFDKRYKNCRNERE